MIGHYVSYCCGTVTVTLSLADKYIARLLHWEGCDQCLVASLTSMSLSSATCVAAFGAEGLAREAGPEHVACWHLIVFQEPQVGEDHVRREVAADHLLDVLVVVASSRVDVGDTQVLVPLDHRLDAAAQRHHAQQQALRQRGPGRRGGDPWACATTGLVIAVRGVAPSPHARRRCDVCRWRASLHDVHVQIHVGTDAKLAGSLRDLGAGAQNWLAACVDLRCRRIDVM